MNATEANKTNGADGANVNQQGWDPLEMRETIRLLQECHDTTEGASLRVILWSFRNDKTSVNLWDRIGDLSERVREEIGELVKLPSDERERLVEVVLEEGWEFDRVDRTPLPTRNWERSLFSAPAEDGQDGL